MGVCPENFTEVLEGLARICAPDPQKFLRQDGTFEPSWAPVFYNPRMVENRDIAVELIDYLATETTREFVVVDPLAATGIRGIRTALEVGRTKGLKIYMGDISDEAVELMKINVIRNGVEDMVTVEKSDANELLYRLRRTGSSINYIDIDPFGSPVPFATAAIYTISKGGVVAFTATDLAVLEGKYRNKLLRRYGVAGTPSHVSKDIAVRILLSYIARLAFSIDRYIEPILSYVYKHYARVYVRVLKGASKTEEQMRQCLKPIRICVRCGLSFLEEQGVLCPLCGSQTIRIEPLWVCRTTHRDIIKNLAEKASRKPWIAKTTKSLLDLLSKYAEIDAITIRLSLLARILRVNTPPKDKVIECLRGIGHKASRSPTYADGIVTCAPIQDVLQCVKLSST
uniref:tRNA (guanine(26)-N(2))-dimethyltransferase n=1 Tax=Ignisphaera aggregans TaxID=334771 RepID=A0A7C2ZC37_9CREN